QLIPGATGTSYTPKQSGNYQVALVAATGCTVLSDNYVYVMAGGAAAGKGDIELVVYPIPAGTQLHIFFSAKTSNNLTLSLINPAGQTVYSSKQTIAAGNFSTVADVSYMPPGTYVLKVQLGQKVYAVKVIVVR
ncbi:MAG: T9SS type A sorting domain-containing protein, partial [Bacteroidota bacterium]